MQDATVGEGVVDFTGVVGGGLVCALNTQQDHISCRRMQQLAAQEWLQAGAAVLICASAASASCIIHHVEVHITLYTYLSTHVSDMASTSTSCCLVAAAEVSGKLRYKHSSRALFRWTDYRLPPSPLQTLFRLTMCALIGMWGPQCTMMSQQQISI